MARAQGTRRQLRRTALARGIALGVALLADPVASEPIPESEPGLVEVQAAASRLAAGLAASDESRAARARLAHWAPVLRGQLGGRDDARTRTGEFRQAPVKLNDQGTALTWGVSATWDLPQLIYTRDEAQLAQSQVLLARVRQQAATEAARLYLERRGKKQALRAMPATAEAARARLLLEILRLTAELEARTGGMFRAALENEEAESARAAGEPARSPTASGEGLAETLRHRSQPHPAAPEPAAAASQPQETRR